MNMLLRILLNRIRDGVRWLQHRLQLLQDTPLPRRSLNQERRNLPDPQRRRGILL